MRGRTPDLLGVLESMYRFDLPDEAWMELVALQLAPLVDADAMGQVGMTVLCPDPTAFRPGLFLEIGVSDALRSVFREGASCLPPAYVADGLLTRSWCYCAELEGWSAISGNADGATAALGMRDLLGVGACDLEGHAVWFGSFQRERRRPSAELRFALTHVGRHLGAVHRLRRRMNQGEQRMPRTAAVLDPGGRIVDATGPAMTSRAREELSRAARAIDASRTRKGRVDWFEATQRWQLRLGEEWTLLETFERDGRRYVVAVETPAPRGGLEFLSARERQVVRRAARGMHDKAIAYELGLSPSTVRVLMSRAVTKSGAGSRRALLELVRRSAGPA